MRNVYPKERTIVCKDEINIHISKKIREDNVDKYISLFQELEDRARMLIYLKMADNEKIFFDILIEDKVISIAYYFGNNIYYLTKITENQKNVFVQFLKNGILFIFLKLI